MCTVLYGDGAARSGGTPLRDAGLVGVEHDLESGIRQVTVERQDVLLALLVS